MELHQLKPPKDSKKKRKRVGRGPGSGTGKTSGRGHGGQNSRSGGGKRVGFEGGQMPLNRRLPKFGFTNIFRKEYQVVNLSGLARCAPGDVDPETMKKVGLIKNTRTPVKVLGNGDIDKAYSVKAAAFSKTAKAKIETAGGKAEVV